MAAYETTIKAIDFLLDGNGKKHNEITMVSANISLAQLPSWYFGDFPLMYDPCVSFFGSNLRINLFNTSTETVNLSINGTISGNIISSGTASAGSSTNLFSEIGNFVTGGSKAIKGFDEAVASLKSTLDVAFGDNPAIQSEKVKSNNGLTEFLKIKSLEWLTKLDPTISAAIAIIDFFTGSKKKDNKSVASVTTAINLKASLTVTGTNTRQNGSKIIDFKTPGSKEVSGSQFKCYYDKPVGTISLLKTPRVKMKSFSTGIIFNSNTVGNFTNKFRVSKHQIELLDPLENVYNSVIVDPTRTEIKAAIVLENVLDISETKDFLLPISSGSVTLPKPASYSNLKFDQLCNLIQEGVSLNNVQVSTTDPTDSPPVISAIGGNSKFKNYRNAMHGFVSHESIHCLSLSPYLTAI